MRQLRRKRWILKWAGLMVSLPVGITWAVWMRWNCDRLDYSRSIRLLWVVIVLTVTGSIALIAMAYFGSVLAYYGMLVMSPVAAVALVIASRGLARRLPPGHCLKCGYNLTGNVSGICPECGQKLSGGTTA